MEVWCGVVCRSRDVGCICCDAKILRNVASGVEKVRGL